MSNILNTELAPTLKVKSSTRALVLTGMPIVIIVLCVVFIPLTGLLPSPYVQNLSRTLLGPVWTHNGSWRYPLGTDQLGASVLSELVIGGRITIMIGVVGMFVAAIPGIVLGLIAGYARGAIDAVISRLVDAQLALPVILVAIALITIRGHSIFVLFFIFGLVGWAQYARVVRAEVISLRERNYIKALMAAGFGPSRIIFRHILPSLMPIVMAMATLQIGSVILTESALSFLGLGIVPPQIDWGGMLSQGQAQLSTAWWIATFPGVMIFLVVILFSMFGDALLVKFEGSDMRTTR